MTLRVAIAGAGGRMGARLAELVVVAEDLTLHALWEAPGHPLVGRERHGVHVHDDARTALAGADVYVDFTTPEASLATARVADELGVAGVVGTTGFGGDPREQLAAAAPHVPLVWAPNMSVGINLLLRLVREAARTLSGYDVEILEWHHRWKVDSPSGTARALLEAAAGARGLDPEAVARHGRLGLVGPRSDDEIGVHAVRAGDIVGDHLVLFAGGSERLELVHRAHSRDPFAFGALRAARWVVGRPPGVYGMAAVLGWETDAS